MQTFIDKELGGHVLKFDGPTEIVELVSEYHNNGGQWQPYHSSNSLGISDWSHALEKFHNPWTDGIQLVEEFVEEIRQDLPQPKDRRRRRRFDEEDGEFDVDRVMVGEPAFYDRCVRARVEGSQHIALLTNLDASACDSPKQIFWRAASAVAACDVLEGAGYTVEFWVWTLGKRVYQAPNSAQFNTVCAKRAGEVLNVDSMCKTLNSWFLRSCIFGSFALATQMPVSMGMPNYELGAWRKHMDVTEGVKEVTCPVVWDRDGAIEAAETILQQVIHQADAE